CRVTEIGDKTESTGTGVKREANRIDGIVRHRKSLDKDVADFEFGAGAKNSPVPMSIQGAVVAHGFGRLRIRVNRHIKFPAENFEPTDVIAMFVSEENAVQLFRSNAALCEAKNDLARAQSPIDQDLAVIGRDQRTITGTDAPEH